METPRTTRPLRAVRADETRGPGQPQPPVPDPRTEDYWARLQALRADLARLRPAN